MGGSSRRTVMAMVMVSERQVSLGRAMWALVRISPSALISVPDPMQEITGWPRLW